MKKKMNFKLIVIAIIFYAFLSSIIPIDVVMALNWVLEIALFFAIVRFVVKKFKKN